MRLKVFIFFLALFAATTAGHIYTVDSYLNYMVTKSMGSHGRLAIPKFMMTVEGTGGREYSKLGIGESLVGLPLFWLGCLIERLSPGNPTFRAYSTEFGIPHEGRTIDAKAQILIKSSDREGARLFFTALTNAFIAAGICLLFWMLLSEFGLSEKAALWGAVLLGFATPLWVYSRDLFAEPLFAICLLGTFYLLKDGVTEAMGSRVVFAGLLSSMGILARASFIPIVAIFAFYLVLASNDRKAASRAAFRYLVLSLAGMVILAVLNWMRFGSPFLSGYHTAFDKGFSVPLLSGLAWNLGSPYRSLFLYAPATILFFLGFTGFLKDHRRQFWLIAAIVIYVFLVYSKWWAWHGGWCWGPRFLVPIIPLLLLPGLVTIPKKGRWLAGVAAGLGIVGFGVQLSGILINYTSAYDYWIKIGKLDWEELDIHLFSPVTVHLKGILTTSPANYDVWLIQAYRVSPVICILVTVGLAAVIAVVLTRILREVGE